MIGAKVIILVFRYAHFVSRIWRQNSSPGSLAVTYLGSRAEISHMTPRRNSSRSPGSSEEARKSILLAMKMILITKLKVN